jgi:hypothetical protein
LVVPAASWAPGTELCCVPRRPDWASVTEASTVLASLQRCEPEMSLANSKLALRCPTHGSQDVLWIAQLHKLSVLGLRACCWWWRPRRPPRAGGTSAAKEAVAKEIDNFRATALLAPIRCPTPRLLKFIWRSVSLRGYFFPRTNRPSSSVGVAERQDCAVQGSPTLKPGIHPIYVC